jgi:hypothetical protein
MEARGPVVLRVLLNHFHQTVKDNMLRCLPSEEARQVRQQDTSSNNAEAILDWPNEFLGRIHYSWLQPHIEKVPQAFQGALISALPDSQASKLRSRLKISDKFMPSLPIQKYLKSTLCRQLRLDEVLPISFLPNSPLSLLVEWDKNQLVELIDFLGIHDLAGEVRHVIDKDRLNKLSPCLTHRQKQFLRICLHQQEKLVSSRIGLDVWQGDCEKLNRNLHRRGLLRLGKALSGQHRDLVWHIAHILDVGRGNILLQYYSPAIVPGVTSTLVLQVTNLMSFLQTKSGS